MKKTILNLGNALNKKQLKEINGGFGFWPRNEEECSNCGGEWSPPLCALPYNSPCA